MELEEAKTNANPNRYIFFCISNKRPTTLSLEERYQPTNQIIIIIKLKNIFIIINSFTWQHQLLHFLLLIFKNIGEKEKIISKIERQ